MTKKATSDKLRQDAIREIQQRVEALDGAKDADALGYEIVEQEAEPTTSESTMPTKTKTARKGKTAPKKGQAQKNRKSGAPPLEAKPKKAPRTPKGDVPKPLSCLAAARKVLGEHRKPMSAPEIIERSAEKGYWKSPGGKTPAATLYAAIIREIAKKGADARFKKVDRGQFVAA